MAGHPGTDFAEEPIVPSVNGEVMREAAVALPAPDRHVGDGHHLARGSAGSAAARGREAWWCVRESRAFVMAQKIGQSTDMFIWTAREKPVTTGAL